MLDEETIGKDTMGILNSPAQQSDFAKWAIKHPYLLALLSALVIAGWTVLLVRDLRAVALSSTLVALLVVFLWRPGGPARRREERLFPPR